MEMKVHSQSIINQFRMFQRNIPQLVLQILMLRAIQNSGIEDCRNTNIVFYESIITTTLSIVFALGTMMQRLQTMMQRLQILMYKLTVDPMNVNKVLQNMNEQFMKYLRQKNIENRGETFLIKDKIEFYPNMMESLYLFLLQNSKYKVVEFNENVEFKGDIADYLKMVEVIKQQSSLSYDVKIKFQSKQESEQQVMIKLIFFFFSKLVHKLEIEKIIKKIYYDLNQKKLSLVGIVACKKAFSKLLKTKSDIHNNNDPTVNLDNQNDQSDYSRYMFIYDHSVEYNIRTLVELVKQNKIKIRTDIKYPLQNIVSELSRNYVKRLKQLFSQIIVIDDEIFSIKLLRKLLQIRDEITYVKFEIKNEKVKKIIKEHKETIRKIKGEIKDDEDYEGYHNMWKQGQLKDLQVQIKVDDETFSMKLFRQLFIIRSAIMDVEFVIKDKEDGEDESYKKVEKIKQKVEEHKETIKKIHGEMKDDQDYEGYYNMREQLKGLKVDVVIEDEILSIRLLRQLLRMRYLDDHINFIYANDKVQKMVKGSRQRIKEIKEGIKNDIKDDEDYQGYYNMRKQGQLDGLQVQMMIDDEIFSMKLFRQLLTLRTAIMDVDFKIKNRNVKKIIKEHKETIQQIHGEIENDEDYEGYYNMRDQLNGLKVELDCISFYHPFYEQYYRYQSQQDQQIIKSIYSFKNTTIEIKNSCSAQWNTHLLKQFADCEIGYLANYKFGLNDYISEDMMNVIKQMQNSNRNLKVRHWINDYVECQSQAQPENSQQNMIKFRKVLMKQKIEIDTIWFKYHESSNLKELEQNFKKYFDEDESNSILKNLTRIGIMVYFDNHCFQNMTHQEDKYRSIRSEYQEVRNIDIRLHQEQKSDTDRLMNLLKLFWQYYTKLEKVKLIIGRDMEKQIITREDLVKHFPDQNFQQDLQNMEIDEDENTISQQIMQSYQSDKHGIDESQ